METSLSNNTDNENSEVALTYNEWGCNQKKLCLILRECFLTHRWEKATCVMTALVAENRLSAHPILKCGMEIAFNNQREVDRFFDSFMSQMALQPRVAAKEPQLEALLHRLSRGLFDEANKLNQMIVLPSFYKIKFCSNMGKIEKQHKYYDGVLGYILWSNTRHKILSNKQQSGDIEVTQIESRLLNKMQSYSQNAIEKLTGLKNEGEYMDAFVRINIKLLLHYNRMEEVQELIWNYFTKFEDNYEFLKLCYEYKDEFQLSTTKIAAIRKGICELSPSDGICIDIAEKLSLEGDLFSSMKILFNLLDYNVWRNNLQPWKLLADHLLMASTGDNNIKTILSECWRDGRQHWWPLYHFRLDLANITHNYKLLVQKSIVATFLLKKDHRFLKKVKSQIHEEDMIILQTAETSTIMNI